MKKIIPFLWFDDKAEEAANFYVSIFKNSKIGTVTRYGDSGPGPKGKVMSVIFQLNGEEFYALNGGPVFKFSEAISFFVNCETQQEVDDLWERLSEGGHNHSAGGSRINMVFPGKSFPPLWGRCCKTKTRRNQKG